MGNTFYTPIKISTATTTLVKTGAGVLGGIFVTGGVAGTIKVYDGVDASGTLILDIGSTNALASYPDLAYGFKVGLCVVTASATILTFSFT